MSNFIDNLAPLFDETKSYSVGDKFLYNDMLYKVKTAFSGSFDASKVKELYLSQIMGSSESSDFECIAQEWDGSEGYSANDFVMHDGKLYVCIDGTGANTFIDSEWKRVYLADVRKYTGFSFKTWLSKANIDSSLYSSLNDVLDDEIATRKLMTIHDSADYLVENISKNTLLLTTITTSATAMKWIGLRDYICDNLMKVADVKTAMLSSTNWEYILKDHVPVMTSNTAPYGECIWDTVINYQYAYYAFDNIASTYWESTNTAYPHYLGYKFTNPICVKKFSITSNVVNTQSSVKTIVIEGSNDGSLYTPIDTVTASDTTSIQTFSINNDDYFMYYRAKFTDSYESGYNYSIVSSLQFYGRSLNVSVPTMTSNTEPWGEAISTTTVSGRDSYYAFNASAPGEHLKVWISNIVGKDSYIGYKFNSNVCVKGVFYIDDCGRSDFTIMYNVTIQGSNNGTVWEDVETYTNTNYSAYFKNIHYLTNSNSYKYWRMKANSLNNSGIESLTDGNAMVPTLNFYGVDYSEREFESGSTMKYIYDHGVELESVSFANTTSSANGIYQENADNIYIGKTNTTVAQTSMAMTDTALNLTNYNLMRIVADGSKLYQKTNDTEYAWLGVFNNATVIKNISIVKDMLPNNGYLDLVSTNDNYKIGVCVGSSTASVKEEFSFNEWWLE